MAEELAVPLLGLQDEDQEAPSQQQQQQELRSAAATAAGDDAQGATAEADDAAARQQGDLEEGGRAGSEAGGSDAAEDEATYQAARAAQLVGPSIYFGDLARLCVFYWAIVSDALLLKELYAGNYLVLAGVATGFTVGPHVWMSLLLIVRQGWLQAATQAVGFILTLNPFENLTPIPQGIVGLFVLSIGFIAYVLIAASGLIFVAYCVVCYLVTALLFSLLILDLAALVITLAPSKTIFKYTDLVYTENFKTSRLVLQAWLQSAPELVVIGFILYRNISTTGPAVVLPAPLLLQALVAHLLNLWDKTMLFRSCAAQSGCSSPRQLLLLLGIRASCRLSMPVLKENLSKVVRGGGGGAVAAAALGATGAGMLGTTIHLSSSEEVADNDSDAAASMVPEYLTPNNGGLLSPGQMMGLSHVVFERHGGPEVAQLVLELTSDVMVGKLLSDAVSSVPNVSVLRLVNAGARGADAAALANALLQLRNLRTLQLHQVVLDERGAAALSRLLEATPTLTQLELCRCKLKRRAAVALAHGIRANRTLRQLNMAGVKGLDDGRAGRGFGGRCSDTSSSSSSSGAVALAAAVGSSKALTAVNLAFVKLSESAVDALVEAVKSSSSLRVLSVSQSCLSVAAARRLTTTIAELACPKAPPSLACNLNMGTFPVEGLDNRVQFLVVQDQESLIMDAWQGLAGPLEEGGEGLGVGVEEGSEGGGVRGLATGMQQPSPTAAAAAAGEGGVEPQGEVELEAVPLLQQPQQPQQQPQLQRLSPAAAFGVVTPVGGVTPTGSPRAAAAAGGGGGGGASSSSSSGAFAAVSALLPRATAAWVSGGSNASNAAAAAAASFSRPTTPHTHNTITGSGGSSSGGSSSSKAAGAGRCPSSLCPCLVFVVEQQECTTCMVQTPLLFDELDTLNLSGLGIGDEGAGGMAKTLGLNPSLRRCVLSDNKIGEVGGAALAAALAVNTSLQVLDLSSNEFSADGVGVIADATMAAAGLRQLRLLGNKIPFGLDTLRTLMQAEASNPSCHLVLVEEPSEVLDALEAAGDTTQVARAADFYRRQEQYRQQRRVRMAARQQRLAQLQQHKAASAAAAAAQQQDEGVQDGDDDAAAAAELSPLSQQQQQQEPRPLHSAWIASPPPAAAAAAAPAVDVSSGGGGVGITTEPSGSSIASIEGQPLRVVVHSTPATTPQPGASSTSGAAAASPRLGGSNGSSGSGSNGGSPQAGGSGAGVGSGSLSSITADEDTCGICFDNNNHVAIKYCGHRLCVDCYRRVWELSGGDSTCPFCRARLEGYMYLDTLEFVVNC